MVIASRTSARSLYWAALLGPLLYVAPAAAQDGPPLTWTPIVSVRARAVGSNGLTVTTDAAQTEPPAADTTAADTSAEAQTASSPGPDSVTLAQRASLGIQVERGILSARVSFQEVRSWTRNASIVTGEFPVSIAEGWASVRGELSPSVHADLTVGRQPIVMGNGRIVGDRSWEMEGQYLDALRAHLELPPFELEYVNARRFEPPSTTGSATGEDPLGFGVNIFRAGIGKEGPITRWKVDGLSVVDARKTSVTVTTLGVSAHFDDGRWRSTGELYVQQNPDGAGSLGAVSAGWVFGPDEGVNTHARLTVQSGDRDGSGPLAAWAPVLGDTHSFLGQLDLFAADTTTNGWNAEEGVAALSADVEIRPWRAVTGKLAASHFVSPVDATRYGEELDVSAKWSFSPFGSVEWAWSHFFANGEWRDDDVDWSYLDLDVAF